MFGKPLKRIRNQRIRKDEGRLRDVNTFTGVMQYTFSVDDPYFEIIPATVGQNHFMLRRGVPLHIATGQGVIFRCSKQASHRRW